MSGSGTDSDMVVCAWDGCDREFETVHGMKIHHKMSHGESIAGVQFECDWCGTVDRREKNQLNRSEHNFCDEECKDEHHSEHISGKDNPMHGRTGEDNPMYGRTGEDHPSPVIGVTGEDHPMYGRTGEDAPTYGRTGEDHPMYGVTGEDNPNWNGGQHEYGPSWTKPLRESIRESQDRQCLSCGCDESELDRKLDVHHIKKARTFDDHEAANDPDNLVALCPVCHGVWEKMSPLKPLTDIKETVSVSA